MESDRKDIAAAIERIATTKCPHCGDEIDVSELAPFSHAECPHCANALVVPAKLGPFLLLDAIGEGGMGGVYRAVDQTLGRTVAIKVMLSSLGNNREFVETFKREAQAAAKLNHPHIAQIYSFGEEKGQPYIVMELVDGRGLDKLIESGKSLDQGLVMRIGLDIAEGLHEADQIDLVHGDIKPENILLDEKMNGKLVDFGIASFANQGTSDGIWGTPYYIAPEKLRRQTIDARSDIYCLGATLYHALSGRPPFEGETPIEVVKARLEHEPPFLHELRSDIDPEIERIIARMLRMDPANRYPTYTSLISDMRKVVQVLKPEPEKLLKSKKIRIRKRSTDMIAGQGSSSSTTGNIPTVVSKSNAPAPKGEPSAEEKIRWNSILKKLAGVLIGILLLLAAAGGGIFLKLRHDREISARRSYLSLTASRQNAETTYADVKRAVTNIIKRAARTEPIIVEVTNTVAIVTEQSAADLVQRLDGKSPHFDPSELGPPRKEAERNVEQPPAGGDATNAAPAVVTDPSEGDGTAADPAQPPHGVPVQAEQATNGTPAATTEATNAVVEEAAAVVPPPEPEEPEPVVNEPEIRQLAIGAFTEVLRVRGYVVDARKIDYEADRVYERAMASETASDIAASVSTLEEMLTSLGEKKNGIDKALDRLPAILKRMEGIKTQTLRTRTARNQATIEEERKRKKEEELRQQEKDRAEMVEREMAQVASTVEKVKPLLKLHQYGDASRDLKRQLRDLQSDEAKEEIQVCIDRYDRLNDLKLFFIKQLNDNPFKWGWIQGQSPEDITGANISHIKLRGRIVSWKDVSTKQMVYFIRHYITRSNQSTPLLELGNYALAAAIFCYENGGYEFAASYKTKAVEFHPRLRREADRLVPDEPPAGGEE